MATVNPLFLSAQIASLRLLYPELQNDEDAWSLSIESETDVHEVLLRIERNRCEAAAMAGGLAGYIAELELRQTRLERRERAMRDLAFRIMEMTGLRKIETAEATFSIANGQPRVVVTDEAALPDAVCKFTRTPDKTKIKEWLKAGTAVPGAALSNSEPHLTIRTR